MADLNTRNADVKLRDSALTNGSDQKKPIRSSLFKYYIHDGVEACRLQLFGEFTETDVADLTGCWTTVKTTLGPRQFIVDVCGLRSADDVAKRWLIQMAAEGATFLPETYERDGRLPCEDSEALSPVRAGLFSRVLSFFRGSRAVQA